MGDLRRLDEEYRLMSNPSFACAATEPIAGIDVPEPAVSTPADEAFCSIERTLAIIGDRWTLLILREVLTGNVTRFNELTNSLGIAPNILTNRLELLTRSGVLQRREYREPGSRARLSYHPTGAGRQLLVVLAALGQWGDDYIAPEWGVAQTREVAETGQRVRVGFVTEEAALTPVEDIVFSYTRKAPPTHADHVGDN